MGKSQLWVQTETGRDPIISKCLLLFPGGDFSSKGLQKHIVKECNWKAPDKEIPVFL